MLIFMQKKRLRMKPPWDFCAKKLTLLFFYFSMKFDKFIIHFSFSSGALAPEGQAPLRYRYRSFIYEFKKL